MPIRSGLSRFVGARHLKSPDEMARLARKQARKKHEDKEERRRKAESFASSRSSLARSEDSRLTTGSLNVSDQKQQVSRQNTYDYDQHITPTRSATAKSLESQMESMSIAEEPEKKRGEKGAVAKFMTARHMKTPDELAREERQHARRMAMRSEVVRNKSANNSKQSLKQSHSSLVRSSESRLTAGSAASPSKRRPNMQEQLEAEIGKTRIPKGEENLVKKLWKSKVERDRGYDY